ncbi:MAG: hypothetical protein WCG95_00080 [bacterium]
MLEVQIEGIYRTNVGDSQKNTDFNFKFEIAGNHTDYLESHLKKRYVPMLVRLKKNMPVYSSLAAFRLVDYKANDKPCGLDGVDVFEMDEWQIQELARYFNLLNIPLPYTVSLGELREKAAIQYLERVKGIPLEKDEDKEKVDFFVKNPSGSWVFTLKGERLLVDAKDENLEAEKVQEKMSLSDVLSQPCQISLPSDEDLIVDL